LPYQVGKCLLSDRLRRKDWTQQQLAEKINVSKSTISDYVNDKRVMRVDIAKNISEVLDCDINDLYEWKRTDT